MPASSAVLVAPFISDQATERDVDTRLPVKARIASCESLCRTPIKPHQQPFVTLCFLYIVRHRISIPGSSFMHRPIRRRKSLTSAASAGLVASPVNRRHRRRSLLAFDIESFHPVAAASRDPRGLQTGPPSSIVVLLPALDNGFTVAGSGRSENTAGKKKEDEPHTSGFALSARVSRDPQRSSRNKGSETRCAGVGRRASGRPKTRDKMSRNKRAERGSFFFRPSFGLLERIAPRRNGGRVPSSARDPLASLFPLSVPTVARLSARSSSSMTILIGAIDLGLSSRFDTRPTSTRSAASWWDRSRVRPEQHLADWKTFPGEESFYFLRNVYICVCFIVPHNNRKKRESETPRCNISQVFRSGSSFGQKTHRYRNR